MKTTVDFLDAVKKKHGLTSDYQLSKLMACTHSSISGYRHGKSKMDEEMACKVAELLNLEPGYVMACIASERATKPAVKAAWKHTAEVLYGLAAALAFVVYYVHTNPLPAYDHFNIALHGLDHLTSFDSSQIMASGIYIIRNSHYAIPLIALAYFVRPRKNAPPQK